MDRPHLRDRRAPRHRSDAARGERPPPVRGLLRRALGRVAPVPAENIRIVGDRAAGLEVFESPGHAAHHVSYLHDDGTLYAGDAAGVRVAPGRFVFPPTPPPEVDLMAWERTLDATERLGSASSGAHPLRRVRRRRAPPEDAPGDDQLLGRARGARHGRGDVVAAARADVLASDPDEVEAYDRAAPYWHCFLGLERYWRKRAEASTG